MPEVTRGTIQRLRDRVSDVLSQDRAGVVDLSKRAGKRRLLEAIAGAGRTGEGPLVDLVRDNGPEAVLSAMPGDVATFGRVVLGSGVPRVHGLRHVVSPALPCFAVPGLERYEPHGAQTAFHLSRARFRVACCGRRFGKSIMAAWELREAALLNPGSVVWLVCPVFSQAEKTFSRIVATLPKPIIKRVSWSKLRVQLVNGSWIEGRSAEIPDNLRGEGLLLVVLDEAALIHPDSWSKVLRPSLSDSRGRAVLVSTPKGKGNFFHQCFLQGQDMDREWESFTFPSWENRYIYPGGEHDPEIEALRRSLPVDVFRQEIEARFIDSGGVVFRALEKCLRGPDLSEGFPLNVREPKQGAAYVMGVDLGRLVDYTALIVLDSEGAVCFADRINRTDWRSIKRRIIRTAARFNNASVVLDSTGLGDVVEEDLRRAKVRVTPFKFTNDTKADAVQNLAVMIEAGEVVLPRHPVLIGELEGFTYDLLPSGRIRYEAPPGLHDDLVCALMLAAHKLRRRDIPYSDLPAMTYDPRPAAARMDGGRRDILDPASVLSLWEDD